MTPAEDLAARCRDVLARLRAIDPARGWNVLRHDRADHECRAMLEPLAWAALQVDAPTTPPELPDPLAFFRLGMSTAAGVALSCGYVRRLLAWLEALLTPPAAEPHELSQSEKETLAAMGAKTLTIRQVSRLSGYGIDSTRKRIRRLVRAGLIERVPGTATYRLRG